MNDLAMDRRQLLAGGAAMAVAAAAPAIAQPNDGTLTALITGCSTGFGRLMAEAFARDRIVTVASMRDVGARNASAAAELSSLARQGLPLHVVEIDVTDEASVDRGVARALAYVGHIDILVNNAGIVVPGPLELQPVEAFASQVDTNLYGSLRVFRTIAPHMRERRRGHVVQLSSGLGRVVRTGTGGYCASKFAIEAMADVIAMEEEPFGIDVTIVQPAAPYPTRFQTNGLRYMEEYLARLSASDRSRLPAWNEAVNALRTGLRGNPEVAPREVSDGILRLVRMPARERPRRLIIGPDRAGLEIINAAHDRVQADRAAREAQRGRS